MLALLPAESESSYRILEGGGSRGEPWGKLGKLREYKGIMGITRLPTTLGPPPLKHILIFCREEPLALMRFYIGLSWEHGQ